MSKVILIIIDGCRPDALQSERTGHVAAVMADGACTLEARTVVPSLTLPVHLSIFTSSSPLNHGVTTNTSDPNISSSAVSMVALFRYSEKKTAAFYSWEHLRHLAPPGAYHFVTLISSEDGINRDSEIADSAVATIRRYLPDFCFIYLGGPDLAGHTHGWMSPKYLQAVKTADDAVGTVRELLIELNPREDYHLIIQSDHGGQNCQHIESTDAVLTIPWIVSGSRIRKHHVIQHPVTVLDTAPTIAALLQVRPYHGWEGTAPVEIFLR